jgi:uncharacterized coiled-coil protein SlyX
MNGGMTAAAADEVRESWFSQLEKQLAEQTMIAQDAARRLDGFNDRLVGAQPKTIERNEKDEQVSPHCAMEAINQQVARLQEQMTFLTSELARLENAGLV